MYNLVRIELVDTVGNPDHTATHQDTYNQGMVQPPPSSSINAKEPASIPQVSLPLNIMSKHDLHAPPLQLPDPPNRPLSRLPIYMNTANLPLGISPLSNLLFAGQQTPVVTRVTAKIHVLPVRHADQEIDMAREMARRIDDSHRAITEHVEGVRQRKDGVRKPRRGEIRLSPFPRVGARASGGFVPRIGELDAASAR